MAWTINELWRDALLLLGTQVFDAQTEEGRSRERYRRIAWTMVGALAAKMVVMLVSLLSIPLTIRYLGEERFGLWMTINSFLFLLGFTDFGIGNSLLNAISRTHAENDHLAARRFVSTGVFLLTALAILILGLFAMAYPFIPWARLFNVTSGLAMAEAGPTLAVLMVALALNTPLGIVQRVQMGYQEGFVTQWWNVGASVLSLLLLLIVIGLKLGLPCLAIAMVGAQPLVFGICSIVEYVKVKPWLKPAWAMMDKSTAQHLLKSGAVFFLLQALTLIGLYGDNLILAVTHGASMVGNYAIPQRLFAMANVLPGVLLTGFWPAYTESLQRGHYAWVRRTLKRSLALSFIMSAALVVPFVVFGNSIMFLWTGVHVNASTSLLAGFGCMALLNAMLGCFATLMLTPRLLVSQLVILLISTPLSIMLKLFLVQNWHGEGVIWSSCIAFGGVYLPMAVITVRTKLRAMEREGDSV